MSTLECAACGGPIANEENGHSWCPSCGAWLPTVHPVNYQIYLCAADRPDRQLDRSYTHYATTVDLDEVLRIVRDKIHQGNACQIRPDRSEKPPPTTIYLPLPQLPPLPPACGNCGSERYEHLNPVRDDTGDLFINDIILCADCGAVQFEFSPRTPHPPLDDAKL